MERGHGRFGVGMLLGVVIALVALALIGLGVVYSGTYNVAATSGHTPFTRWLFDTALHNSVEAHAPDADVQARLAAADITAGAHEFKEYCVHCHGGPGAKPAEWTSGMLPNPPDLSRAAREWAPEEIYWVVHHGIKFTGMPPFGEHHDPQTLWNITAFVERLPGMTPEQFAAYGGGHGHASESGSDRSSGKSTDGHGGGGHATGGPAAGSSGG